MLPPVSAPVGRTYRRTTAVNRGDPVLAVSVKLDALKPDVGPDLIVIPEFGDGAVSVDGEQTRHPVATPGFEPVRCDPRITEMRPRRVRTSAADVR